MDAGPVVLLFAVSPLTFRLLAATVAAMEPPADYRIKVSTTTRAFTDEGERAVQLVALSAKTALLFAPETLGAVGGVLELLLPAPGRADIRIMAGINRVERVVEGYALTVQFIVADADTRRALNELLALLLAGDGGGARQHPRILYDVSISFGPEGNLRAKLEQISLSGLEMRVLQPLAEGVELQLTIPQYRSGPGLELSGHIVNQRPALEGGYYVGIAFGRLDAERRMLLSRLLADLMCR